MKINFNKKLVKNLSIGLGVVLVLLLWEFYFSVPGDNSPDIHGKVIKEINNVKVENKSSSKNKTLTRNYVLVKIINGTHKGEIIKLDNLINEKTSHQSFTKKGDEVLINLEEDKKGHIKEGSYIYDVVRYKYIYTTAIIFVILLALVGGKKGIKSVLALIITGIAVIKIMLPLIIAGFNPIVVSVFICFSVSILNLLIISGKNKKTLAAIIGTCGGVLIAAVLALVSIKVLGLSGLTDEEQQNIIYLVQNTRFNFNGLLFAGILMGALGAVMDVSMSIASSINEINEQREMSTFELIKSGMNVGKDIMGTMANTLILAYAGGAMYILIWMSSYDLPFYRILNQDVIASEVMKSLIGSIGLIFTIPLTAICSAIIFKHKSKVIENTNADKVNG